VFVGVHRWQGLYKPDEVAYIKPATQCIDVQLVSKFCNMHGASALASPPLPH
jgi:hypothetical protein